MRRNRFQWWSKFNFVLSAALDSGTVLSGLFIFFALQLPRDGSISTSLLLSFELETDNFRFSGRLVGE